MSDIEFHVDAGGDLRLVALSWDGAVGSLECNFNGGCRPAKLEERNNRLQVWDLRTGGVSAIAHGPGTTKRFSLARAVQLIAMLSSDGEVTVSPLSTFNANWTTSVERADDVAITSDGKRVLVLDEAGAVRMLDGRNGHLLWKQNVLHGLGMVVGFSPGDRYFAVGGDAKLVTVFDTRTQKVIARLSHAAPTNDEAGGIFDLAFAPDEKSIATVGMDSVVRVFSVPSGKLRLSLHSRGDPRRVAWSPDSATLAYTGLHDTAITFVYVADGRELRIPTAHTLGIRAFAFSPDGQLVASGSEDSTIRIWKRNMPSAAPH